MGKTIRSLRPSGVATGLSAIVLSLAPSVSNAAVYAIAADGSVIAQSSGRPIGDRLNFADVASGVPAEPAPEVPAAAITTVSEPNVPETYRQYVLDAASRADLSPRLLAALTTQESRWHAQAVSRKGAMGLTQLMPATAQALAVDARNPEANLVGGARYLRQLIDQFDGNIERALAAYNAGPARVARVAGIPAISETRAYVSTIVDGLGGVVLNDRRK